MLKKKKAEIKLFTVLDQTSSDIEVFFLFVPLLPNILKWHCPKIQQSSLFSDQTFPYAWRINLNCYTARINSQS